MRKDKSDKDKLNKGRLNKDKLNCGKSDKEIMDKSRRFGFEVRELHNLIKHTVDKSIHSDMSVKQEDLQRPSQLQAGILGYLYHHREEAVYQKDLENEFRISRATATNTLQVMEKNNFIVRSSMDKDQRLKRITMTEAAIEHHRIIEKQINYVEDRMLEGLSENEIEEIYSVFEKIKANLLSISKELTS